MKETHGHIVETLGTRRSRFGDAVLVAFLVVQLLDGVLTYLGIVTYGPAAEGNPLSAGLMRTFGHAEGLLTAKLLAISVGAALHLRLVHRVIAVLTGIYIAAAIVAGTALLLA